MQECKNCNRWVEITDTGGECDLCELTREVTKGSGYLEINGEMVIKVNPIEIV